MIQEVKQYLEKYPQDIIELFTKIREIVFSVENVEIEEKLWAKLPSYYVNEKFVRIIPFKDHLNIEATGLQYYLEELKEYKFTPKLMLQIKVSQKVNEAVIKKAFEKTFE